jgi:O-antigen ligase
MLLLGGILFLRNITYNVKWFLPREGIYLFIFWVASVVSILKSATTALSIKESVQLLYYVFEFFVVLNIVKGSDSLPRIVTVFIFSLFFVNLASTYTYMTGMVDYYRYSEMEVRRASFFSLNPVLLASYLSFCFVLLISSFLKISYNPLKRLFSLILAIWTLILILLSFTRGAVIALGGGLIIFTVLLSEKHRLRNLTMIILLFTIFLIIPSPFSKHLKRTRLADYDSFVGRIYLTYAGVRMIKNNPFLGVGIGTFPKMVATEYSDTPFPLHIEKYIMFIRQVEDQAHNSFLQYWAETGTAGIFFLIAALARVLRAGRNYIRCDISAKRHLFIGFYAAFLVIVINNLLVTSLSDYFWIPFGVISSIILRAKKGILNENRPT